MTGRDRLAADLRDLNEAATPSAVMGSDAVDVYEWLADRLIALGWTLRDGMYIGTVEPVIEWEIDEERLARALRSERVTGWLGLLVRHCGGKWSGIPLSPDFSSDMAAAIAKAYRGDTHAHN